MFTTKAFPETYDLYRPTAATGAGGAQRLTGLDASLRTAQPCRFLPRRGGGLEAGPAGAQAEGRAVLWVPADHEVRPTETGQLADQVVVRGRRYVVEQVTDVRGAGLFQEVQLRERRV